MLKKLLIFFTLLILFILSKDFSYAQDADSPQTPIIVGSSITFDPEPIEINGNTPSVDITFSGLKSSSNWHICTRTDGCGKAEDNEDSTDGILTLTVCAANDNRLKRVGHNGENCDDGDYFHEGKVYTVTLFEDEDQERKGPQARFFVNHFYPNVTASINDGFLEVVISGNRRPFDGNGGKWNPQRNNYQVRVEGVDDDGVQYGHDGCSEIKNMDGSAVFKFGQGGYNDEEHIRPGKYLIKVNEQVNEGGIRKMLDECNGGFTYWHINATIENGSLVPEKIDCTPESSQEECKKDPNSSDIQGFNKLIEELGLLGKLTLKCNKVREDSKTGKYECLEVRTAIGNIPTDPIGFIERLFSIVLTLAGVAALGLLIYGGYNYMISRGDPEKIKGARETITSAIIGLLFIIFSLVILQVIAGDILRIPGFTTP